MIRYFLISPLCATLGYFPKHTLKSFRVKYNNGCCVVLAFQIFPFVPTLFLSGSWDCRQLKTLNWSLWRTLLLLFTRYLVSNSFATSWAVACEDFPGKNTGMGCHSLLPGIFPTQELNMCLLHWQTESLPASREALLRNWSLAKENVPNQDDALSHLCSLLPYFKTGQF